MSILVTGGAGFIGSHFVEYLLNNTDQDIVVLDRLDSTATLKRLHTMDNWDQLKERVHIYIHDLKKPLADTTLGEMLMSMYPIYKIYHFAASSHVTRSIQDPLLFVQDNVIGTCNLLDWIKTTSTHLVHISTDEVFGEAIDKYYAFKEYDRLAPSNPYSASKAGAEHLVMSYAYTYGMNAKIVRLTNVIGIKQHPEKFIPLVIKSILDKKSISIHMDRSNQYVSTRYYIDIRDICRGIDLINKTHIPSLSKENTKQGVYHLSGPREIDNGTIVRSIGKLMKLEYSMRYTPQDISRPNHDLKYRINDTLTQSLIGWYPVYTLDSSLETIVKWYSDHQTWLSTEFYTKF